MLPRDLPPADVVPFARRAEELGFAELWVVEDLGFRGGIAQAASVLASTSRITVGIGILPAGARNAVFAAMELATLEQLFPGRLIAGVGHGMPHWMRSLGAWPASPLTLLEEYLTTVRALLRGDRVSTADTARYVEAGGCRPRTLLDSGCRPTRARGRARTQVARGLGPLGRRHDPRRAGRPGVRCALPSATSPQLGPHRLVTFNIGSVHPEASVAIDAARPGLAVIGEPDWAPHIEPLPFAAEFAALRADSASGRSSSSGCRPSGCLSSRWRARRPRCASASPSWPRPGSPAACSSLWATRTRRWSRSPRCCERALLLDQVGGAEQAW